MGPSAAAAEGISGRAVVNAAILAIIGAAGATIGIAVGISQPLGGSTGWITRCSGPPSPVTRVSTATKAVNRHSTPKRSETSTIRRSREWSPMAYRSSRARRYARAHTARAAGLRTGRPSIRSSQGRPSAVRPCTVRAPAGRRPR